MKGAGKRSKAIREIEDEEHSNIQKTNTIILENENMAA